MRRHHLTGKPSKLKERKRKILVFKGVLLIVFLISIFLSLVWVSRLSRLNLDNVLVEGNSVVDTKDIQVVVKNVLSGSYAYFFPKSSVFLYPRKNLEAELISSIPNLETAKVETNHFSSLRVAVKERKPFALYCTGICYFVDRDGLLFKKAPAISGSAYIRFQDVSTTSPSIGSYIYPNIFGSLNFFITKLVSLGVKVVKVESDKNGDYILTAEGGAQMYISGDGNFDTALQNFESLLSQSLTKLYGENPLRKIDYVDLRFGNRLYYKAR